MKAIVRAASQDYLFATWGDLVIAVWRGVTTLTGVRLGQHFFQQHAQQCPSGVLLMTIIEEGAPAPGTQERAALGMLLQSETGRTRRSAVVYEGTGFRAATVRSVVTGLALISRPPFPHKVFATVAEASLFLGEGSLPSSGSVIREMVDAVGEVRSRKLDFAQ